MMNNKKMQHQLQYRWLTSLLDRSIVYWIYNEMEGLQYISTTITTIMLMKQQSAKTIINHYMENGS